MKGQLSFEFLVYTALMGASLLAALAVYARGSGILQNRLNASYAMAFFGSISSVAGYSSGNTIVYVPKQICGPAASIAELVDYSESQGIPLEIDNSVCGHSGELSIAQVAQLPNGTYWIRVVG